ncbi:hypothetical protein ACWD5V_33955 [Streptomyces sp. NPDC002523]
MSAAVGFGGGSAHALREFLREATERDGTWWARRLDIADRWPAGYGFSSR